MKFSFFHLMPWTDLTEAPTEWPAPNAPFNGERGTELYDAYISAMAYAEDCGFDWVAANEHHYSPYSLMANCNLVGAALTQRTRNIKLAMLGNLLPLFEPDPGRGRIRHAGRDERAGGWSPASCAASRTNTSPTTSIRANPARDCARRLP